MNAIIDFLNTIFWGYVLIYGLLAVGIYFTIRLGFLQIRHFGEMFRVVTGGRGGDQEGISPFQALMVSLASRVGVGNLTGVAVALYLGGPGAIFWMWMVALVGMATAFAEATLAQLYKTHGPNGLYRGGPAFYISKGLGLPWLGSVFAVCLILSFGLIFNAVQANSIAAAVNTAFGIPTLGVGLALAALAGIVIFGGIRQIARVAEVAVPFMAVRLSPARALGAGDQPRAGSRRAGRDRRLGARLRAKPRAASPAAWRRRCSTASSAASSPTRPAWGPRPTSPRSRCRSRIIPRARASCRRSGRSSTPS